ncbi:MAG: hypothetical protein U0736_23160 [Gemmataceae bacterium]
MACRSTPAAGGRSIQGGVLIGARRPRPRREADADERDLPPAGRRTPLPPAGSAPPLPAGTPPPPPGTVMTPPLPRRWPRLLLLPVPPPAVLDVPPPAVLA